MTGLNNMLNIIDIIYENIPKDLFSAQDLKVLIKGSADSRYGIVKRAVAAGKLIQVKKGLYCLAKKYQRKGVNLYELSRMLYGPSYISFESALSYHQWIPEAVYTLTGACAKRAKSFSTPLGEFSYTRLPSANFYMGVERVVSENGVFFMAAPFRALADYVYANKKNWTDTGPLVKDLRIEPETLRKADISLLGQLSAFYRNKRTEKFIRAIKRELS
jgi:hypothetical protein